MTNIVLAAISLAVLGAFLGMIAWRVPQPALIVVFAGVFLMAVFDFWRELRKLAGNGDR